MQMKWYRYKSSGSNVTLSSKLIIQYSCIIKQKIHGLPILIVSWQGIWFEDWTMPSAFNIIIALIISIERHGLCSCRHLHMIHINWRISGKDFFAIFKSISLKYQVISKLLLLELKVWSMPMSTCFHMVCRRVLLCMLVSYA